MGFYVESADRPKRSRLAAEDITVGSLVAENGSDQFQLADAQNDNRISYVADKNRRGDQIAFDEDDTLTFPQTYSAADNNRVIAQQLADGDVIKTRTALDGGGNESAPSISDGDVVGVIDSSAGTLSDASAYHGRVVEEGYTDGEGTPTTYNRSNGNFVPLGVADKDSASSYDEVIRVMVQRDLEENV
jgi:hypothetical protein